MLAMRVFAGPSLICDLGSEPVESFGLGGARSALFTITSTRILRNLLSRPSLVGMENTRASGFHWLAHVPPYCLLPLPPRGGNSVG